MARLKVWSSPVELSLRLRLQSCSMTGGGQFGMLEHELWGDALPWRLTSSRLKVVA